MAHVHEWRLFVAVYETYLDPPGALSEDEADVLVRGKMLFVCDGCDDGREEIVVGVPQGEEQYPDIDPDIADMLRLAN